MEGFINLVGSHCLDFGFNAEYVAERGDIWSKLSEENEEGSDKKETPIGEKASPSKEAIVENV